MNQNESDTLDVSDAALERAGVFGYDRTGAKHMFDSVRAQVIVVAGDEVEHVEQLARDRVVEWIDYIAQNRGWIDQWYTTNDLADATKRRQIAEAKAADIRYEQAKAEAQPQAQEAV